MSGRLRDRRWAARRRVGILLSAACATSVAGCGLTSYKVGEIDYSSEQSAAAIIIGDPQVYARASLINDRRREVEYLQQLLANSAVDAAGKSTITFSPQIMRDLKTIEVLSASLGLSFGKTISDSSSAAKLGQQIEVAKLEAQLAVLQKQIEGIQNAKVPEVTIPAPDLSAAQQTTPPTSTSKTVTPDITALQTAIKDIQAQLAGVPAVGGVTAPSNNYGGLTDPRDEFMDRQAYRRDVRAALAEAQLDDEHDTAGNALYRLQFQATVLPLKAGSRQWGGAKLRVEPPMLDLAAVTSLYYGWLGYLSDTLSRGPRGDDGWLSVDYNYGFDRYVAKLAQRGYFDLIDLYQEHRTTTYYCVLHSTASDDILKGIDDDATLQAAGKDYAKLGTYAVPPGFLRDTNNKTCDVYSMGTQPALAATVPMDKVNFIFAHLGVNGSQFASGSSALNELAAVANLRQEVLKAIAEEESANKVAALDVNTALQSFSADVRNRLSSTLSRAVISAGQNLPLPAVFCTSVLDQALCPTGPALAASGSSPNADSYAVRSYSVLPTELVQRLGVTTESTQSLQTALSVAAQLSATTSGGLGVGYLKQSDARAEALSRQPLVVGFSGSTASEANAIGSGYFGWLFGPQFAVKDSKTLDLAQTVRAYGVNADVSIPGWWTHITLDVSTAWIGDWSSAELMADTPVAPVRKRVRFPVTMATFESLTNYIAASNYLQNSGIIASYVTPDVIPACASSVTFQIGGANIWRADNVFLGGTKAKAITVLPDMKGVAAQFDMSEVFGSLAFSDNIVQQVPLLVSAMQGSAPPLPVYLLGKRQVNNGVVSCQSPLLVPTNAKSMNATVLSSAPTEVCSDTKSFPLVITGFSLENGFSVDSSAFEGKESQGNYFRQVLQLQRRDGAEKLTPRTLSIVLKPKDIGRVDMQTAGPLAVTLTVKDCKSGASDAEQAGSTATLVTTSVKIAKDQSIALKAKIPPSYSELRIAVRPKSPANAKWVDSDPIVAEPGDASAVSGVVNLTGLQAKPGDKLEVILKIRLRPDLDWEVVKVDGKSLEIAAAPAAG